jgi:hypothetical protein
MSDMLRYYKVLLDGNVFYMADQSQTDGLIMPIWTNGDATAELRVAQGEGTRQPLTDVELLRLQAGHASSSEFRTELESHERLCALSLAYLQSAKSLCNELLLNEHLLSWPRGSVVYYCLHMAVELFLKAAIMARNGTPAKIHSIPELVKKYRELFPGNAYHFHTVWGMGLDDIEEAVGATIGNAVDRKPEQVFRYFSGRSGELPSSTHFFSPGTWLFEIEWLEKRWTDIWSLLSKTPIDPEQTGLDC